MTANLFPKGSEWRKWDLHVHTPLSLRNNYGGDWDKYLSDLEQLPPEITVLGINDYNFLDGYKRIRDERVKNQRLKNITTIFPVVEFRIKKFAGVEFRNTKRINLHVIFDPDLEPELIESQFLNTIHVAFALDPGCKSKTWAASVTRQSLEALGASVKASVPPEKLDQYGSDLEEGFNNLNVDEDQLLSTLEKNSFLKGRYLIGIGKSEWDKIAWDDTSIAEKKDIINKADIIFTASANSAAFEKAKEKLSSQGVNNLLLDCSDAHNFSNSEDKDKLGNCLTWVKADPTFKGLLQLVNEAEGRCFVGAIPPKLSLLAKNKTKFIGEVRIQKKPDGKIKELWFDNISLPINPDLVAIIGNKGKGKSALTDVLGLLANTKQSAEFTFLSDTNFRQPKDNKSKHFQAELIWESGQVIKKGLNEDVDEQQPELVKYIPQNFLETICTQIGHIEESEFDHELKKVIFSHIATADQLGKKSLDEILEYKTSVATESITLLKQELSTINKALVEFEDRLRPEFRKNLENLLKQKKIEFDALAAAKPKEVVKPDSDPTTQEALGKVLNEVEKTKEQISSLAKSVEEVSHAIEKHSQAIAAADRLLERIENFERQMKHFAQDSEADLSILGLSQNDVIRWTCDKEKILEKRKTAEKEKNGGIAKTDATVEGSLAFRKKAAEDKLQELQSKLDEPNKKYQAYLAEMKEWESKKEKIQGAADQRGTVKYYEDQILALGKVGELLEGKKKERLAKALEIYDEIERLAVAYRALYAAVNNFIAEQPLAKDRLHLKFEVSIVDTGFENEFFEHINCGVVGTFCGVEEGHKRLVSLLESSDFNSTDGIKVFLTTITDALEYDLRTDKRKSMRVADQIKKKDKTAVALYDLVFGLDYLRPRYALQMNEKDLHELSPGERGALLLVFYLLVDKGDVPLIIDQPEENLDNQTVFELLVPCIKAAKIRRQIIIVTHNPNLAVVCDAEQVIHADLDKKGGYRMQYNSGSIESLGINKSVVDILEGTMPAFSNRGSKYHE